MENTPRASTEYLATVLIADDNPAFAQSLQRLIRPLGFRCVYDSSSANVLELAKEVQPDLILLDLRQRVDGRDILMRLKRDEETKDIPVIMLSAHDDQFTRRLCFELGAQDYAVKPVDIIFLQRLARFVPSTASVH